MRRQTCEGEPPSRAGEASCFDEPTRRIELKGNLAAMLGPAVQAKRSPETGDLSLQIVVLAGACNQRYLQLWRVAA